MKDENPVEVKTITWSRNNADTPSIKVNGHMISNVDRVEITSDTRTSEAIVTLVVRIPVDAMFINE